MYVFKSDKSTPPLKLAKKALFDLVTSIGVFTRLNSGGNYCPKHTRQIVSRSVGYAPGVLYLPQRVQSRFPFRSVMVPYSFAGIPMARTNFAMVDGARPSSLAMAAWDLPSASMPRILSRNSRLIGRPRFTVSILASLGDSPGTRSQSRVPDAAPKTCW